MAGDDLVGREIARVTFPVERSKLLELARAFHDEDAIWSDVAAARAAGFTAIPTPPTVTTLMDHWRPGGAVALAAALGMSLDRLLHGEVSWEYRASVTAGDELTAVQRVESVSEKSGGRGGPMTLVVLATTFVNQTGVDVAVRRDTLIETGGR
jgi:hypothetical protein